MIRLREQINEAVRHIRERCTAIPQVGIILGTGLGSLADRIEVSAKLDCADIPHFPTSTVDTHAGQLVFGRLAGKDVLALARRFHCYEGYSMRDVTFPVRVANALGIRSIIVSNAAGGLNPQFSAGDLMVITDHINLMGDNPLIGLNDDSLGPRFLDMSEPYSKHFIALAESIALAKGIRLQRGVYLACLGPSLETRAEYRLMRSLGADAVGMSTVPEVIVAVHAGLRVLAFSAITDMCLPDALEPAELPKVIATSQAIEPKMAEIVIGCLEKMEA